MRGGLPQKEPEILKQWQDMDLYAKMRESAKSKEKWILHDGPPYANGDIHMGHALNKILKDVVVKSYSMLGYNTPYVPGWDCHGLPIEWKMEEKYRKEGKDKDDVEILKFREECREFAQKWVDIQSKQFERLGITGDWENPYLTMNLRSEGKIVREIHKFAANGGLYKGKKPVMWSVVEKTALAEAEVEYKEHKSITIWINFPIIKCPNDPDLEGANIVIWTTTPWTMPSNRAIAFGDIAYALYEVKAVGPESRAKIGDRLLIAEKLAEDVKEKAKITEWSKIKAWGQANAIGDGEKSGLFHQAICAHPLRGQGYDFDVPLLEGDFVTEEAGTGFVHIAPGHGEDDFYLGTANGIEVTDNVTDDGKFREHVPLFAGLEVYTQEGKLGDGNFAVLKAMAEAGKLLAKGSLKHEYPHSWRSKAPVIFRTTPQWFISMETNDLRKNALKAIAETRWVPAKGEARINAMIQNRPDWCISRQRAWGVPIALFVHKETDEILRDEAVLTRIGDIFEEEGSDAWWSRPAQDFLGNDYNVDDYDQVFDIVDVWFESGSTHAFVVEDREDLAQRADLYLEGSDQHRGWFHSSLLESVGTRGQAPYKAVLTHGFVLDEHGKKMSKSDGNIVDPLKLIEQSGADIVRLWALTCDFSDDIRIGKDSLKTTSDLYRRIRNTLRFLLGALDGFTVDEKVDLSDVSKLPELEQLMLHQLHGMDEKVRTHIANYDFMKMTKLIHDFCNEELSSFYFDIRKDSLYCDAPDSFERRATRTVMAAVFDGLVSWLAPVLAFTAEEAWSQRPEGVFSDENSIHLREFSKAPDTWKNDALAEKWNNIRALRKSVSEAIEPLRTDKTIGSSLEALPIVSVDESTMKAVEGQNLEDILITSSVQITSGTPSITVGKTPGSKCERCWKVLPEVEENGDLCNRCTEVVAQKQKAA